MDSDGIIKMDLTSWKLFNNLKLKNEQKWEIIILPARYFQSIISFNFKATP